jgi:fructose-bisphosphate aldolase class 1
MRMLVDVAQPQWDRLADQLAEDAASARQVADRPLGPIVDPEVDKTLELGAIAVKHTQRRVLGRGELSRSLHNRAQHRLEVQL